MQKINNARIKRKLKHQKEKKELNQKQKKNYQLY